MAMSTWFCSSGFGPGPSKGGLATVWNGLAGAGRREVQSAAAGLQQGVRAGGGEGGIGDRVERVGRSGQKEAEERRAGEPDADGVGLVLLVLAAGVVGGGGDARAEDER